MSILALLCCAKPEPEPEPPTRPSISAGAPPMAQSQIKAPLTADSGQMLPAMEPKRDVRKSILTPLEVAGQPKRPTRISVVPGKFMESLHKTRNARKGFWTSRGLPGFTLAVPNERIKHPAEGQMLREGQQQGGQPVHHPARRGSVGAALKAVGEVASDVAHAAGDAAKGAAKKPRRGSMTGCAKATGGMHASVAANMSAAAGGAGSGEATQSAGSAAKARLEARRAMQKKGPRVAARVLGY